ncbi:hypothetical protein ESCOMA049B1_18440 [Escherichia coli]|nr:hypothetical protein [Escherichia coli]PGF70948.1 hypothetical protein BMR20_13535 [Escherichia coli]GCO00546.1 hypothetical protein ExPECSC056_03130 [Escherichia coli]
MRKTCFTKYQIPAVISRLKPDGQLNMYTDFSPEKLTLNGIIKKTLKPTFKRELVTLLITIFGVSFSTGRVCI